MPCYDPDWPSGVSTADGAELEKAREKINKLTDMLCRSLRILTRYKVSLDPDIRTWWEEHSKVDAERQEYERLRAKFEPKRKR